jgi:eukaryotic-like serine/threonine-protein kinase
VMELVDGPSLETVLTCGPLDGSRTMDIVAQAAAGLQAAHAAGMIHRDIKPDNLLLAPGGTVKITDFGIAHTIDSVPLTASGELIGTPGYLAPERAMGERATPASDLYSLGMLAYECLAGAPPFRGTPLEVALAHRDRPLPPLPPSVAVGVAALVMRLAAKDPARRPNDAEVAVWAGLLRDGVGVAALQMWPEQPPATGLFQRRTILAYACVAVTTVVVIVLASVIGFASTPGRVAAAPASAPAPVPSHGSGSGGDDVTAPPARGPAASPGQPPAARSVVKRRPAAPNPGVGPAVAVADPAGPGPDPGHGNGKGPDHGPGAGHGHEKAKNQGSGQDD